MCIFVEARFQREISRGRRERHRVAVDGAVELRLHRVLDREVRELFLWKLRYCQNGWQTA
jgi:hypothetical protein